MISVLKANPENPLCMLHQTPYGQLIRQLETRGDYSAYNLPKSKGYKSFYKTNLTSMTLAEIRAKQRSGDMFAAGAYQVIPDTLAEAMVALKLNGSEVFTKELQDRIFNEHLAKRKRTSINSYFYGKGSISTAALATAQEWASMSVNVGVVTNKKE